MQMVRAARCALFMVAVMLQACAVYPERPYVHSTQADSTCDSTPSVAKELRTPELAADGGYALHFVEFDDQGWLFPDGSDPEHPQANPSRQIDCAVAGIAGALGAGGQVLAFVYVHGWKHSARDGDRDVNRFRDLLSTRAKLFPGRRIVGIYVGWQGNTVDTWGLKELTFWGRKNAAQHVAEGRVRELFSRIRGLRDYWNGPAPGLQRDCDWELTTNDQCRLRTIMIGHSFGGLILYNSAAPYLMEMLSATRDLPTNVERAKAKRARSIADLIVLLNPAFEGSRYEPVFQASQHYKAGEKEPPILVMLTSSADLATKNAFPIARWFNSVFQYPASSEDESDAMRRTPGHTLRFLTHDLCVEGPECEPVQNGESDEPGVKWAGSRRFCGGLVLRSYASASAASKSIIWNVRTNGTIIPDHSEIGGEHVFRFIAQLYGEVDGSSTTQACDDVLEPMRQAVAGALP